MLVSSLLRSTGLGGGNYKSPHGDGDAALGGMSTMLGRGEVELFVGTTSPTLPPTPSSTDGSADAAAAAKSHRQYRTNPQRHYDESVQQHKQSLSGDGKGSRCHATGWHTDFQENENDNQIIIYI